MTTEFTANFTIPPTALNGPTRLRVRSWDQFNGWRSDLVQLLCVRRDGGVHGGASPAVPVRT